MNRGRLLRRATPETLINAVEGKVWEWVVPSEDLAAIRQNHLVSSLTRRSDGARLRIVQEMPPSAQARPVPASLEDAYLFAVANGQKENAA